MKTPEEAKEKIRQLIHYQQDVQFAGGISPNSELYKNLLKTQDELLAFFNLEQRPLHYLMLSTYPFSPNNVRNTITVETKADYFGDSAPPFRRIRRHLIVGGFVKQY
jgi:hypothetical protein